MDNYNAMRIRSKIRNYLLLFIPTIFIAAAVIVPIIYLIGGDVNLKSLIQILGSGTNGILTRSAISNSLVQGALSSVFSFVIGLPLGLFLGRYDFRLKRTLTSFVLMPFFLPSIVVVYSFITGFGSQSILAAYLPMSGYFSSGLSGIISINTFFNAPLVALFTMTGTEQSDSSADEAAMTLSASRLKRFRTVWGRSGLIAGAGASLITFVYSFTGFAAPLIIGGPKYFTLDTWIYFLSRTLGNVKLSVLLALVEVLILLLPVLVYMFFLSGKVRTTGNRIRSRVADRKRDIFFKIGIAYITLWVLTEIYLISSVVIASLHAPGVQNIGSESYTLLFGSKTTSTLGVPAILTIANSLFYATIAAFLVVTIGLLWVVGKRRLKIVSGFTSELAQYIPLILSAIVLAFCLYVFYEPLTPPNLLWLLIIVAQSLVAIPVVLRVMDSGFSTIPRNLSEAADLLKGNSLFEVELPMAKTTFATALMFAFAMSLGEFTATNFIANGSFIPLSVEIYQLQQARLFSASYAAASILMLLSVISFYVIQRVGERFIVFR